MAVSRQTKVFTGPGLNNPLHGLPPTGTKLNGENLAAHPFFLAGPTVNHPAALGTQITEVWDLAQANFSAQTSSTLDGPILTSSQTYQLNHRFPILRYLRFML